MSSRVGLEVSGLRVLWGTLEVGRRDFAPRVGGDSARESQVWRGGNRHATPDTRSQVHRPSRPPGGDRKR